MKNNILLSTFSPSHVPTKHIVGMVTCRKQQGLTLIELLVAMTISLFMLIALALVYSTSKTSFAYANNTVQMSEDASFALELMSRDVRMAGFAGCTGSNFTSTAAVPPVEVFTPKLDLVDGQALASDLKPNPFLGVITGNLGKIFTAKNAVWGFVENDTTALGVLGGGSSSYTLSTTNPVLYLAGGSSDALQITAEVAAVAQDISIAADTYNWANDTNPIFLVIADCKGSEVFRRPKPASGSELTLTHDDVANNSANFANTYGADAIVTPLTTSVYFLATRSGASTPSLYRRHFSGSVATVEELVPNVEAIQFQYGENTADTDMTGGIHTYHADVYRTDPTTVDDWSRVVSVRIGLIMVSEDNNKAAVAGQTVPWIGGTYTPTSDSRLRRAYSTTVSIRNRMGL